MARQSTKFCTAGFPEFDRNCFWQVSEDSYGNIVSHCHCPHIRRPDPRPMEHGKGGKISGVQRFASGGRAGRSRLGHPIKKR